MQYYTILCYNDNKNINIMLKNNRFNCFALSNLKFVYCKRCYFGETKNMFFAFAIG